MSENLNFADFERLFRDDKLTDISLDPQGTKFLKLRSMSRKDTLINFAKKFDIRLIDIPSKKYFETIFNHNNYSIEDIDKYILEVYWEERIKRIENEEYLIDQLSRLKQFDWGGSFGNSLEKNIVDNYVKKIQSYDVINEEIEGTLLHSLRGYTLNSWYNHWTSILIEDIFKDNVNVLPTIGLVKKIDFFINSVPFDLKVTYFPEQLLAEKLRQCGFGNELTKLKQICRKLDIFIPNDLKDKELKSHLYNKINEDNREDAKKFILELKNIKKEIIGNVIKDPQELKVWFYENQGEARFDASNRFFLVLTDENDLSNSWKLKRDIRFLKERIFEHLQDLVQNMENLKTEFYWKKNQTTYSCMSDILFISK